MTFTFLISVFTIPISDFPPPLQFFKSIISEEYNHITQRHISDCISDRVLGFCPLGQAQESYKQHSYAISNVLYDITHFGRGKSTINSGGLPATRQKSLTKKRVGCTSGPEAKTVQLIKNLTYLTSLSELKTP